MSVPVICGRQACGPAWMSACRNRAGALPSPSSHALSGHAPETQPLCSPFLCSRCPRQSPPRLGWTLPRNTAPPPPTRNLRRTYLCQVSSFWGAVGCGGYRLGALLSRLRVARGVSFSTAAFMGSAASQSRRMLGRRCFTSVEQYPVPSACIIWDVMALHIVFGPCAPHKSLGYVVCRLRPL